MNRIFFIYLFRLGDSIQHKISIPNKTCIIVTLDFSYRTSKEQKMIGFKYVCVFWLGGLTL